MSILSFILGYMYAENRIKNGIHHEFYIEDEIQRIKSPTAITAHFLNLKIKICHKWF